MGFPQNSSHMLTDEQKQNHVIVYQDFQ